MTVPLVSPRSQASDGACGSTSDSPPGQNASISSRAARGTLSTSPSMVDQEPTSTGTGMSGPRLFAASSARTGVGGERVAAEAVDGVGGQHDEPPGAHGAGGRGEAGGRASGSPQS